jgi:uncharacterized iron-regulated membrane protein
MNTFRSILFWMHLSAGLVAGLCVFIMCFTGTIVAFEDEIVEWSERDARAVAVPAGDTPRLSLSELQRRLREEQPDLRAPAVTLRRDPAAAVAFAAGRDSAFYANPYTGEIRQPASTRTHDFMHTMIDWHRFLGREGDQRPIGKAINGACNLAFCFLAISGLYLWMPRSWSWRSVRAVALFHGSSGKARDFNWHNVIGLWCAPILIVLTLTAVPISYRWGSNLVYRLVGEEPPVQGTPPGGNAPAFDIKRPSPDARPLAYDAVVAQVQEKFPRWEQIAIRSGAPQRGNAPAAGNTATAAPAPNAATSASPASGTPGGARPEGSRGENAGAPRAPQPLTVTIREPGSWPRTATTTLTLNPFTGEELKREGFADFSTGRQLRTWTRFLHTGQALGWVGQLVAGLACLGGCFLVYTGFALSWRRFFTKKTATPDIAS